MLLKAKLPEKIVKTVFSAMGILTLFLGFSMALKAESILMMVFALVLGTIIGELLDIERFTERQTERIKKRVKFGDPPCTPIIVGKCRIQTYFRCK